MRLHALVAAATLIVPALAGAVAPQRTFVSTAGSDANTAANCSLSAPCRSFGAAIGVVATNGEVIALDSGGYGSFAVTKSVTVTAPPGVYAGISVPAGTNGVDIATADVNVILRGLTINGQGGNDGINFQTGASLVVERCTISGMIVAGILARAAGVDSDHPSKVLISGATIANNTVGVELIDGPVSVTLARSTISDNANGGIQAHSALAGVENSIAVSKSVVSNSANGSGIFAAADGSAAIVSAVVSDSTFSSNWNNGVYIDGNVADGAVSATVTRNVMTENWNGAAAGGLGTLTMVVGDNTISRNRQCGVYVAGTTLSRGDNTMSDNGVNFSCTSQVPMGSIGGQ